MIPVSVSRVYRFASIYRGMRELTHRSRVMLFARTRRSHRVGLSRAGLAIGQDGDIVALNEGVDAVTDIVPDSLLRCFFAKDTVKDEQLLSLSGLDGEIGRRRNVTRGGTETLGDQIVTGI